MSAPDLAGGLAGLLGVALAGRVALSLAPPGAPGSHRPGGLFATWAASQALGLAAVGASAGAATALGLEPSPWAVFGPWAALALARAALLPGAFVPRREPPAERKGPLARLVSLGAAFALLLPLFVSGEAVARGGALEHEPLFLSRASTALLGPACFAAAGALVLFGLERARRPAAASAVVALFFATAPFAQAAASLSIPDMPLMLLFALGSSALVPWLRRGDRRGGALSALGFAACAASDAGLPLACAGLAALLATTRASARREILAWSAAGAAAALFVRLDGAFLPHTPRAAEGFARRLGAALAALPHALADVRAWGGVWIVAVAALLLGTAGLAGGRPLGAPLEGADRPHAARRATVLLLALALAAEALAMALREAPEGWSPRAEWNRALLHLLPVAAMAAGLVLAPAGGRGRGADPETAAMAAPGAPAERAGGPQGRGP